MNEIQEMTVHGMTCQGCRQHVEEALYKVEGVLTAEVNLEKASAVITAAHKIPLQQINAQLGDFYSVHPHGTSLERPPSKPHAGPTSGYYCPMQCEGDKIYPGSGSCPVCGMDLVPMVSQTDSDDSTYKSLLGKFWIALGCTIPVFLIAMSEMWPQNPLYRVFAPVYWNYIQLAFSLPVVFYAAWMFFERAYTSLITWKLNMFTLIGIGAGIAWLFSLAGLLFPDAFPPQFKTEAGDVHVYFEAATVILTLVLLGQVLEARAHGKTGSAIRELLRLAPQKATRLIDGSEESIAIDAIQIGDVMRVKPGEKIPVDGLIIRGESSVNESMISGEAMPVIKKKGDSVHAGTLNEKGSFDMQADRVGAETLLSRIVAMVQEASRSKAPVQRLADTISAYFVPIVVLIAIITFIIWAIFGPEPAYIYGLVNAIAVLIIACPCALGLATPMSVMVGVGKGAQNGILIKNAGAIQKMNDIDTLIIDKTGTITEGAPTVLQVVSLTKTVNEKELLALAASLNRYSEHPLGAAMVSKAKELDLSLEAVTGFQSHSGKGVSGYINSKPVRVGNTVLMRDEGILIPDHIQLQIRKYQSQGNTVPLIAMNNEVIGFAVIGDRIKESSKNAISALQALGIEIIMLTGDNSNTAAYVAREVGIGDYRAELLPEDKLRMIAALQSEGKNVAMAGDGINDAPALAQSDVGIAMGTGTDVAIESAEITLVKGDLIGIVKAKNLSRKVMLNIRQNLFFALIYNTIGVPVAAGVLFPVFGILLSPMIAALAMSFSSVSVIANALRLRTLQI